MEFPMTCFTFPNSLVGKLHRSTSWNIFYVVIIWLVIRQTLVLFLVTGGEEKGFEPSEEDLMEIDRQFELDKPLPPTIPPAVKQICDKWCQDHFVSVNIQNAKNIYLALRSHINNNL